MLQKYVYSYKYMQDWKKISEKSLLEQEDFYSDLNMEDTTDAGYRYTKRVPEVSLPPSITTIT